MIPADRGSYSELMYQGSQSDMTPFSIEALVLYSFLNEKGRRNVFLMLRQLGWDFQITPTALTVSLSAYTVPTLCSKTFTPAQLHPVD